MARFHLHPAVTVTVLIAASCAHATAAGDDAVPRFLDWFSSVGAVASNVSLGVFPRMGTGVLATEAVREGERVFSVPLDVVMCRDTILRDASLKAAQTEFAKFGSEEDLVAAFLVLQRLLGPASRWRPYLAVLPTRVPVAFSWTETQLAELQVASVAASARKQRAAILRRFSEARVEAALRKSLVSHGLGEGSLPAASELQALFLWATSLVTSRALTIRGHKYLVPFADMFNHAPHPRVREAAAGELFLHYHRLGRSTFDIFADRNAESGSQLFEDYGDNDNTLYLTYHGFVVERNPFDCAHVQLPPLRSEDTLRDSKRTLLASLGMDGDVTAREGPGPVCVPLRGEPPRWVSAYLRVLDMDAAEMEQCAAVLGGDRSRLAMQTCFGSPRGDAAEDRRRMHGLLTRQIGTFASGLVDDEAELARLTAESAEEEASKAEEGNEGGGDREKGEAEESERRILALRFRIAQKRILSELEERWRPPGASAPEWPQSRALHEGGKAPARRARPRRNTKSSDEASSASTSTVPVTEAATPSASSATTEPPAKSAPAKSAPAATAALERFMAWFRAGQPPTMKIEAAMVGDGMRIGVRASEDIRAGDVYLSVPVALTMDQNTARNCSVLGPIFRELDVQFPRGDPFHELLFHLLFERFVRVEKSFWWPYLATLPTAEETEFPLFWTDAELAELTGTPILDSLRRYRASIHQTFVSVKRAVFNRWPAVFGVFSEAQYTWAHAVLDSRSIWWSGERHLVPLLDLINCDEGPDPNRVHSTDLDRTGRFALTRAGWSFPKGSQLFENYGQPNYIYFQYHGFTLDRNAHDCARIDLVAPVDSSTGRVRDELRKSLQVARFSSTFEACLSVRKGQVNRDDDSYLRAAQFARIAHELPDEEAADSIIARAAHDTLRALESFQSIADDELLAARLLEARAMESSDATVRHRWAAVRLRLAQKRLLRTIVEHLGLGASAPRHGDL